MSSNTADAAAFNAEQTPLAVADLVRYKVHCKNVGFATNALTLKAYFEANYGPVISVSERGVLSTMTMVVRERICPLLCFMRHLGWHVL